MPAASKLSRPQRRTAILGIQLNRGVDLRGGGGFTDVEQHAGGQNAYRGVEGSV